MRIALFKENKVRLDQYLVLMRDNMYFPDHFLGTEREKEDLVHIQTVGCFC